MGRIAEPAVGDMDIVAVLEAEANIVASVNINAVAADGSITDVGKHDGGNRSVRMAEILRIGIHNTDTRQERKQFFHFGV
jgi:hypothetical protein